MFKSCIIGTNIMNGGLYRLGLNECVSFQTEMVRRLSLISMDRKKRLMKDRIISSLLNSITLRNLLEIIHTEIYGPFLLLL